MNRETFTKSFGSVLQLGCAVLLLGLVPYSAFACYQAWLTVISWTGGSPGFLAYPLARVLACIILVYAIWQLRKTGLRLRGGIPPRR